MKRLKKLFLPILATLFVLSTSCGDKDDNNGDSSVDFKVGKTSLSISVGGDAQEVAVQSSENVTLTPADSWLKVEQKSAANNIYKYTVSAEANLTGSERKTTIEVSSGSNNATIEVTQATGDIIVVDADTKKFNLTKEGGNIIVKFKYSGEYKFEIKPSWITESTSKALTDGSKTFTVKKSSSTQQREGKIIFSTKYSSDTVTVTQEKGAEAVVLPEGQTAMDIAKQMYPGWNLGNTLEATGGETSWQPTKTTQEIISYVKEKGFNSVRIPCSWYIHSTQKDDYKIDETWMARVKEVVDYCIKENLFVFLNDHWDNGWLEELGFSQSNKSYSAITDETIAEKKEILEKLWTQIAEEFKDYDNHLLFGGQNEPFQNYELFSTALGNNKGKTLDPILLQYNQTFIDAVRATGGNNKKRILVVQAPSVDLDLSLESYFTLPTDETENAMMLEIHYYAPWNFCGGDNEYYWGTQTSSNYYSTWRKNESEMSEAFAKMKTKFADKGVPMLIGEYGANWRDLSTVSDADQNKHDQSIKEWFAAISKIGPQNGMVPMVWDINSTNQNGTTGTMTIIDRNKLEIFCTPAYEGIMEGTQAAEWMK